jgi:hypothetical protein
VGSRHWRPNGEGLLVTGLALIGIVFVLSGALGIIP